MHVTLRRALAGAFIAGLTAVGVLWPTAQAQNFSSDDVSRASAAEAGMFAFPYNPQPARGGVLHDNGPLNTGTTTSSGVAVPTAGYEWSEVQNDAGNTTESNTSAGATCTGAFRMADDFVVPDGETWTITSVTTYAYQTNWAQPTSPINSATLQIWDGTPPGGTVVFGDGTTNRFNSSVEANLYRVFNTSVPPPGTAPNTARRVWATTIDVSPALELGPGTYWVDYAHGTVSGGLFCPSVTIVGTRGLPGWNAMQSNAGVWAPYVDTGNPGTAPDVPQDMPFIVGGTSAGGGGTTFCSGVATNMPGAGSSGPFAPYPNAIAVSGVGTVTDVNIRFMGTSHTFPDDLDIFIEGPTGATAIVMSDAGGSTDMVGVDITFDDEAAAAIPDATAITTGSYQPFNYGTGDVWDAPAPVPAANSLLSVFDGVDANGTWNLWGDDDVGGDLGAVTDWCIDFTVGGGGPGVNTYPSTDTPLPIADGSGSNIPGPPTISTITVPPSPNVVLDVDVDLQVTHSWAGDVIAVLTHGAGASTIYDRPGVPASTFGCSGDNPTLIIDDEGTGGTVEGSCTNTTTAYPPGVNYTPNTPLTVFDNLPVQGDWVLTVTDNALGDTGSLTAWAIIVTEDIGTASPGEPGAAVASLRALPNPMSASGTIELSVPTSQHVRVAIYDMLGREVMVVFDREISASQRALIGIGADRLDSGVYVVRATGEDFSLTQRLTVTR
jgi:subtilisin-like proprotein convertase family protein